MKFTYVKQSTWFALLAALVLSSAFADKAAVDECGADQLRVELDVVRVELAEAKKEAAKAGRVAELSTRLSELEKEATGFSEVKAKLEKQLSALKNDLKQAKKKSAGDAEVERLKESLAASKKEIALLRKRLNDEKARSDGEIKKLKAKRAGSDNNLPLYLIAFQRGRAHSSQFYDSATLYYSSVVEPRAEKGFKEFKEFAAPHLNTAHKVTKPLRERAAAEFEKVRPQYEREVEPKLNEAKAAIFKQYNTVARVVRLQFGEFKVRFGAFRSRSINTLKSQPSLEPMAEEIIDAVIVLIVLIVGVLLVGPMFQFFWSIFTGVFYYGLCCCCCCGGRKSKATAPGIKNTKQPARKNNGKNNKKK